MADNEIVAAIKGAGIEELDDEQLEYLGKLKFAITCLVDYPHYGREVHVKMIMEKHECSRSHAYKLLSEAIDVYPSIEKVSKAFERARLAHICYKMLNDCVGNETEYNKVTAELDAEVKQVQDKYKAELEEAVHVDHRKKVEAKMDGEIALINSRRPQLRKSNPREAAQFIKLLKELYALDQEETADGKNVVVLNVMKYDLKSLNIELPPNFELETFINQLESEYKRKPDTIDISQ